MIDSISIVIVECGIASRIFTYASKDFKQAEKKFRDECKALQPEISKRQLKAALDAKYFLHDLGASYISVNLI